jgi:RNA polymerase sigma factor (sigma-70 family)
MSIGSGGLAVIDRERPQGEVLERLDGVRPDLLAVALSIVFDVDEAEDLVQTTIEIALRRSGDLRASQSLLPWLLRIETREAFRLRRRLRRVVRFGWQQAPERVDPQDIPGSFEVRDALRRLPPRIRAAVVLHHMTGLSVAESAIALGVSENTVKTQLKRGLALLREDLGHGR